MSSACSSGISHFPQSEPWRWVRSELRRGGSVQEYERHLLIAPKLHTVLYTAPFPILTAEAPTKCAGEPVNCS